jgi:hypothetical protein
MPGSRNLVIFLGIGLVIVRFWTSGQRTAMSGLWNAGGTTTTSSTSLMQGKGNNPYTKGGGPGAGAYSVARGGR